MRRRRPAPIPYSRSVLKGHNGDELDDNWPELTVLFAFSRPMNHAAYEFCKLDGIARSLLRFRTTASIWRAELYKVLCMRRAWKETLFHLCELNNVVAFVRDKKLIIDPPLPSTDPVPDLGELIARRVYRRVTEPWPASRRDA